jgi:hypothetical protein
MSTQQARVHGAGPANGQWATEAHTETGTTLRAAHPAQRSDAHARLDELGVGAGVLSLLAPVEAKTVLGSMPEGTSGRAEVCARAAGYLHWRDLDKTGPVTPDRAHRIATEAAGQYAAAQVGFTDTQSSQHDGDEGALRFAESQLDLMSAVRRFDAANEDVHYLSDPSWRPISLWRQATANDASMGDFLARSAAHRRFADPAYRGQVH